MVLKSGQTVDEYFLYRTKLFVHTHEQRKEVSGEPVVFVKPQSALLQQDIPFFYPRFANELYCGCELVLLISENGKDIQENLAGNHYDFISVGLNFTALHNQEELKEGKLSWEKAKAWNNSSVVGKWVPAKNFKNKRDINFCLYKNRKLMQLGNSGLMINNFDIIISGISKSFPINMGDLIFTGTPAGITELMAGDKLEAFIEDDSLLEFDVE